MKIINTAIEGVYIIEPQVLKITAVIFRKLQQAENGRGRFEI